MMRHDPAAADDSQSQLRWLVSAERLHATQRGRSAQNQG
jgi:hypothetical protein